jgi:hypothetical protein
MVTVTYADDHPNALVVPHAGSHTSALVATHAGMTPHTDGHKFSNSAVTLLLYCLTY